MAMLVGVRWVAGGYLSRAEEVGWGFLSGGDGKGGEGMEGVEKRDTVLVTLYGDVVIGCVVLRIVLGERERERERDREREREKGKGRKKVGGGGGGGGNAKKGLIRAWTVGLRWRGRGVGRGLLEEAVRVAVVERGCETVEFAEVHASEFFWCAGRGWRTVSC